MIIRKCGVDEAGRGPLAGSVFAAAVILGDSHGIEGLADSKVLSASKREALSVLIKDRAVAWHIASASVEEIERLNILHATMLAMQRAVNALGVMPDEVLVDGNRCPKDIPCPARSIVKGDAKVAEISAASILAKVARDAELDALDEAFPGYGFSRHKGYPTPEHLEALRRLGPSDVHRRGFGPVKALLVPQQTQFWA